MIAKHAYGGAPIIGSGKKKDSQELSGQQAESWLGSEEVTGLTCPVPQHLALCPQNERESRPHLGTKLPTLTQLAF